MRLIFLFSFLLQRWFGRSFIIRSMSFILIFKDLISLFKVHSLCLFYSKLVLLLLPCLCLRIHTSNSLVLNVWSNESTLIRSSISSSSWRSTSCLTLKLGSLGDLIELLHLFLICVYLCLISIKLVFRLMRIAKMTSFKIYLRLHFKY